MAGAPAGGSEEASAGALLEAGVKAHKLGKLDVARGFYERALEACGVAVPAAGAELQGRDLPANPVSAEALHMLGALIAQRCQGQAGDASDSEDDSPGGGRPEMVTAISLLRGAVASLPASEPEAQRARQLNTLGTALLRHGAKGALAAEAADCLREASKLDASRWSVWHNLARALQRLEAKAAGEDERKLLEERILALHAASKLKPDDPGTLYRLAFARIESQCHAEAIEALERYLTLAKESDGKAPPTHKWKVAGASHWLSVLRGETSATAPAEYVASLFDSYAEKFDEHLVQKLGYRTPELLADAIKAAAEEGPGGEGPPGAGAFPFRRCVDLGCGTGLMGPLLRELGVEWLGGVDLSEGMLRKARECGRGYDRLLCGDVVDIFSPSAAGDDGPPFDLVVAADVFVYIGDLAPVLTATAKGLAAPHGLAAFSTECPPRSGGANEGSASVPEGGYRLADTGRYMHSALYVRQTAEACGLKLAARRNVVLRRNSGKPVHGHLHIMRLDLDKAAATGA